MLKNTVRVLISLPLVLLPLLLGGARPWLWSLVAGIFFAGMMIIILDRLALC